MRKFINIISEALRPTATKTATAHDLDSLLGPDTSHQQVATAAPSAVPAAVAAPRNAGGAHTRAAVASGMRNVNTGNIMRDLANHAATHDFHDEISDEQARLNAGHNEQDYVAALGNTGAAQLGAPVAGVLAPAYPVTPDNLPTVIHQQLMAHGDGEFEDTFDPEWHQIRHLPGYMQTMIRSIGRRVFSQFTTTPIEDINMICEILNRPIDVQKMATWIVRNGHKEDEMTMDFGDIVPGFTADCTLWRAGGVQYLIMRDVGGHYIYAWPETVREVTNRTAPNGQNAAQIGQTRFLEGDEHRVHTFPSQDEELSEETRPFVIQSSWINHLPSKRMDTKFWEIVSAAMDELGIDKATAGGPEIDRAIALVKDKMKSTYDKIDKLRAQAEKIRQKVNGEKGKLPDTPFHTMDESVDFYAERHSLKDGDVFRDFEGDLVKLDRRVPGDGTKWYVAVWTGSSWSYDDNTMEPGDLRTREDDPDREIGEALDSDLALLPDAAANQKKYFAVAYGNEPEDRHAFRADNDTSAVSLAKGYASRRGYENVFVETEDGLQLFDGPAKEPITEAPERYTIVRNSRGYMIRDNEIGVWQTACPTREAAQSWIAAKVEEDKKPKDWKGIRMPVKD